MDLHVNRNKPFILSQSLVSDCHVFYQDDTEDDEEEVAERSKPIAKIVEEEESAEVTFKTIYESLHRCAVLLLALSILIFLISCMHSDLSSDVIKIL